MKTYIIFGLLFPIFLSLNAQPCFNWVNNYDMSGFDDYGRAIDIDNNNNIYFTGFSGGYHQGSRGFFVVKTNSLGDTIYKYKYPIIHHGFIQSYAEGHALKVDSLSNIYTLIQLSGSIDYGGDTIASTKGVYLLKMDSLGIPIWHVKLSKPAEVYNGLFLSVTPSGNCYVIGNFINQEIFGNDTIISNGDIDLFLTKIDSKGDFKWTKSFGSSDDFKGDKAYGLSFDQWENIYIAYGKSGYGYRCFSKYDSTGVLLYQHQLTASTSKLIVSGYCADKYGNSYLSLWLKATQTEIDGSTIKLSNGEGAVLVKYDSSANLIFSKVIVDTIGTNALGIKKLYADENQNLYIIGSKRKAFNLESNLVDTGFYVLSYNKFGTLNWTKSFAKKTYTASYSTMHDIKVVNSNLVFLCNVSGKKQFDNIAINTKSYEDVIIASMCTTFCPVSDFNYVASSLTVGFMESSQNAINWHWDFGDGLTDTMRNPTHVYDSAGIYKVCLISSNSCGSDSICDSIKVISTNVNHTSALRQQIKVYPNPFSTSVTFKIEKGLKMKNPQLSIYNIFGKEVKNVLDIKGLEIIVDRKGLPDGIYFYKLMDKNQTIGIGKLIIE